MKKLLMVSFIVFYTFTYGQEKTHSKNPRVIIRENYKPEKWRVLAQQDQYIESASELLYLVQSDSSRNKHADFWHIGQMYAMGDQYEKAIFYMTKAKDAGNGAPDKQWLYYFHGTIAFLNRDREALEKYADLLDQHHTEYYANNSKVLQSLLENFEKPYSDAY